MKQYRPLLFIVITLLIGWTLLIQEACAQQLKQIQKGTANNQIPVTNGYQYTQVYRNAIPYILDTLGIRDSICCTDSIFIRGDSLILLRDGSGQVYKSRIFNQNGPFYDPIYTDIPNPQKGDVWVADPTYEEYNMYYDGTTWRRFNYYKPGDAGNLSVAPGNIFYNSSRIISFNGLGYSTGHLRGDTVIRISQTDLVNPVIDIKIDTSSLLDLTTQYLNPYVVATDTVGFYLTVAQDTVLFQNTIDTASYCCPPSIGNDTLYIGDNYVVLPSGEATTVGDTPTINMTLTGVNITGEVIDGSITPAKLDRTYLETEIDGSTTNEIELPSQTGNSGKYLSTNGTTPSWETVSGGSSKVIDILGSDFTTSATSLQSTALAYTFPTTGTYEIKVYGSYTCSNTANGINLGYIDSGGLVASYITGKHMAFTNNTSSGTTETRKPISAIGTTLSTASVSASSTQYTLISEALITVSTAGTITFGFASGSGSYSATLQAGSSLIIEKLN